MGSRRSKSKLVDPEAGDLLETAADAIGVTVEGLTNLVVDSGAIALPPSDGVTERYSLEDLGVQMRTQLAGVAPERRPEWFGRLVESQQIALVTVLRTRGYSSVVVAQDFGIPELEVNKIYNRYADDLGAQVVNVRLNTLVGHLQLLSERSTEVAAQKQDAATMWRIGKEMIGILQSLGIVKQAIRKVEVAHKFEDQQKAEVDALLDLERMKRERIQEIADAESISTDAVPQLELPPVPSMEGRFEDVE